MKLNIEMPDYSLTEYDLVEPTTALQLLVQLLPDGQCYQLEYFGEVLQNDRDLSYYELQEEDMLLVRKCKGHNISITFEDEVLYTNKQVCREVKAELSEKVNYAAEELVITDDGNIIQSDEQSLSSNVKYRLFVNSAKMVNVQLVQLGQSQSFPLYASVQELRARFNVKDDILLGHNGFILQNNQLLAQITNEGELAVELITK